jgi:hypothetical protein
MFLKAVVYGIANDIYQGSEDHPSFADSFGRKVCM